MKNEVKNAIIISIVVILVLIIVYLTTAIFMTGEIGGKKASSSDDKTTTTNPNEVTSIYDNMIIAGETFLQKQSSYMVLFFSNEDATDSLKYAISGYNKDTKLYKVNTDEAINSYVIAKDENINVSQAKDLKVKVPTLLKIKDGVVSSVISNESDILNELK